MGCISVRRLCEGFGLAFGLGGTGCCCGRCHGALKGSNGLVRMEDSSNVRIVLDAEIKACKRQRSDVPVKGQRKYC